MDFSAYTRTYSEEQERLRTDVRAWIEKNAPEKMRRTRGAEGMTEEQYRFWRAKHKELGAKGWLYPSYPKQYGGGGMSEDLAMVIQEEFDKHGIPRGMSIDFGFGALLVWGTEAQKQKFLAPVLRGEKTAIMKFTEPHSGCDLASYESTAVRDGDDWILNGSNVFISGHGFGGPDLMYGPMLTDPDAPRHRNLGYFMIPNPTPGLVYKEMQLLSGGGQHFVYLDNVRVPGDHLIGGDHQGWQVAMSTSEKEHGGEGRVYGTETEVTNLLNYLKEQRKRDQSPGGDPVLQQSAVEAYLDAHKAWLFDTRNAWMYNSGTEMSWEGPAGFFYERHCGFSNQSRIRHVMGMHTLLGAKDPLAPLGGAQEQNQRSSFIHQHGAGSLNITKVVLARRIGISRTKERAAITPKTMGARSGE